MSSTAALSNVTAYPAVDTLARTGSAVSAESQAVRQAVVEVLRARESSQSLFGRRAAVISQIWALVNECDEQGWDGSGAEPVDRFAAFAAVDLIRALPEDVPLPEVAPEPDGSISLDWIESKQRIFSLSVGTSGRLAFAWLDGSDRGHGAELFDGERIPRRVMAGILEIVRDGRAAIGTR